MEKLGISASEVARRTWGTTVDSRGRTVARNRDRVGHYLAGTSYPEPDNLEALAKAVEVPVEALAIERPASAPPVPRPARMPAGNTLTWTRVPNPADEPKFVRLQFDQVLEEDVALDIYNLLRAAEKSKPNGMPEPGTVINGDKRAG